MKDELLELGLVGYPLGHSLSPRIHNAALQALGLPGAYHLYPIPPLPEGGSALETLIARLHRDELHGLNVTIPHKQAVASLLDELSPTAQSTGAVNTIFKRDERLVGENTDVPGFLAGLYHALGHRFSGSARHALVLGAGGAAHAVVYALAFDGWTVHVAARRVEQARALVARLQSRLDKDGNAPPQMNALDATITAISLDPRSVNRMPAPTLIVNATPVGMAPHIDASPWPEGLTFPAGAVVYDLVYNPAETALVRKARSAGLVASTGLGMLIEQAALALELWTGKSVPRAAMWQAVQDYQVRKQVVSK